MSRCGCDVAVGGSFEQPGEMCDVKERVINERGEGGGGERESMDTD